MIRYNNRKCLGLLWINANFDNILLSYEMHNHYM